MQLLPLALPVKQSKRPPRRVLLAASTAILATIVASPLLRAQSAELRWGGEGWAAHTRVVDEKVLSWIGGGGGRIDYSPDALAGPSTWMHSTVPADATGSILDIWFEPTGIIGYACGRGGRILKSENGGVTWTWFGSTVFDNNNDPATLWGVRPITFDGLGMYVTGLWCLRYTWDGGLTWKDIEVYNKHPSKGGELIPQMLLEAFKLDLIRTNEGMIAAVGAEYENPTPTNPPEFPYGGVIIQTDTRDPASAMGTHWWITTHDMDYSSSTTLPIMTEPWALRFEVGTPSLDNARGIVVGGRGGNTPSRWWTTENSGKSWKHDPTSDFGAVTMYDAAITASGAAVIVGYSGSLVHRDSANTNWLGTFMDSPLMTEPTPGDNKSALLGACGFHPPGSPQLGVLVTGDFGTRRISAGTMMNVWPWIAANPAYPCMTELEFRAVDIDFQQAPLQQAGMGLMVGQLGRIYRTADGGTTWTDLGAALGNPNCNAVAINISGIALMVGASGVVMSSTDAGLTWSDESVFTAGVEWTEVALSSTGQAAVAIGQNGTGQVVNVRNASGTWSDVPPPAIANLAFEAVRIDAAGDAVIVGRTGADASARATAFWLELSGATPTWYPLALPASLANIRSELLDVAVVGGIAAASATCYAVGEWDGLVTADKRGLVLELQSGSFAIPSTLPSGIALDIVLRAVDLSPSGNRVLIGGDYSRENDEIDDAGLLLVRDNGTWSRTRSDIGKGLTAMKFVREDKAFGLGLTDNDLHFTFINAQLGSTALIDIRWN